MAQLQSTSITGSLIVTQGITGSFSGSISNATSASYAATASYALNAGDSVWTGSAGNIYYNGGNVGIGTSSPYSKLEVTSVNVSWGEGIIINPANSGYGSVFFRAEGTAGSTYTGTWAVGKNASSEPGGELLQVVKNGLTGGTGYRVDALQQWKTNGDSIFGFNVGIGTTNPGYKLDVSGQVRINNGVSPGSGQALIVGGSGDVTLTDGGSVFFGAYDYGGSTYIRGFDGSDIMYFYSNGTNLAYFRSDRAFFNVNVGIGTSSPDKKLVVLGDGVGTMKVGGPGVSGNYTGISLNGTLDISNYNLLSSTSDNHLYINRPTGNDIYFRVNNDSQVIIKASGNVGIGTTNPSQKLEVAGYGLFQSGVVGSSGLTLYGDNSSSRGARLTTAGSFLLGDTAVPGESAWYGTAVFGKNGTDKVIAGYLTSGTNGAVVGGHNSALTAWAPIHIDGTEIRFNIQESRVATINSSGNVGIGSTNPGYKLDVNGSLNATSINTSLIANGPFETYGMSIPGPTSNFGNGKVYLRLMPSASVAISTLRVTITTTWNWSPGFGYITADYSFYNSGGTLNYGTRTVLTANGQAANTLRLGELEFENGYLSIPIYSANTNTIGVRIEEYGGLDPTTFSYSSWISESLPGQNSVYVPTNIGIGITNPQAKLDVYKGLQTDTITRANSAAYIWGADIGLAIGQYASGPYGTWLQSLKYDNNASFPLSLNPSGGSVGIGTNSPVSRLHVYDNSDVWHTRIGGASGELRIGGQTASGAVIQAYTPGGSVRDLYVQRDGGSVGIGTSSPGRTLDINGTTNFRDATYFSNGSVGYTTWGTINGNSALNLQAASGYFLNFGTNGTTGRMVIDTGGNVGIGNTSPGYKLDVSGIISTTTSPGSYGTIIRVRDTVTSGTESFGGIHFTSSPGTDYTIGKWTTAAGVGLLQIRDQAGNQFVTINSSGNVGIGITNPSFKLHVVGVVGIGQNTNGTATIDAYGGNAYYGCDGTQITVNGNSGNVGIGNTSPSYKLDVIGLTRVYGSYLVVDQTNGYNTSIILNQSGLIQWYMTNQASTGKLVFGNGNGDLVWIGTTGNVGIGTSSPNAKLDVQGGNTYLASQVLINGTTNSSTTYMYDANGGSYYQAPPALIRLDSSATGDDVANAPVALFIHNENGTNNTWTKLSLGSREEAGSGNSVSVAGIAARKTGGIANGWASGDLYLWTKNSGTQVANMVLKPSGNVGIGTTSPTQLLHIVGTNSANNGITIQNTNSSGNSQVRFLNTSGTERAAITYVNSADAVYHYTAAGGNLFNLVGANVGINTTSPGSKLEVNGTFGVNGDATFNGTNTYINSDVVVVGNNSTDIVGISGNTMYFPGNGNVGIGTTSPAYKLVVLSGTGINSEFRDSAGNALAIRTLSGRIDFLSTYEVSATNMDMSFTPTTSGGVQTEAMRIQASSGNVGIGTTSPGYKLQVAGNSYFGDTIYNGGGYISWTTGYSDGTTQTYAGNSLAFLTNSSSYNVRMFISSGGNVGIGTTSPGAQLSIFDTNNSRAYQMSFGYGSTETFRLGNNNATGKFTFTQLNNNNGFRITSSAPNATGIIFDINTSQFAVNGDTGNVGIGTTSPASLLHVYSTNGSPQGITIQGGDESFVKFLQGGGGVKNWGLITTNLAAGDFGIYQSNSAGGDPFSAGTAKMYFNNDGNVGIGNTSPGDLLTVGGNARIVTGTTQGLFAYDASTGGAFIWSLTRYTDSSANDLNINTRSGFGIRVGVTSLTNNGHQFYINNSGNVGIGTTSPSALLHVSQPSANTVLRLGNNSNYDQFIYFNGGNDWSLGMDYSNSNAFVLSNYSALGTNDRFVVTTVGNVGIGVTAPAAKLQISGSSNVLNVRGSGSATTSSIFSVDGNNGRLFEVSDDLSNSLFSVNTIAGLPVIEAFADYTVTMGTYGAYTLQVTGSRVGVGTSSPGYPLHVSGSVSGISIYATNDIAAFSDQSVKTDLQVIDSAVDRIKQINGYTYVRVDDLSNTRRAGVIAQEVQKVLPEVVSENQDGTLNVAYQNMIALLIEGMKEQQLQIDELKQRLDNL